MNYSIQQLQNLDSQLVISGNSTRIDYIQGGKYVIEGIFNPAQAIVKYRDWLVVLEDCGNGFEPISARNTMTGTEYSNPLQWFSNKVIQE
jgi:hypothetical protein